MGSFNLDMDKYLEKRGLVKGDAIPEDAKSLETRKLERDNKIKIVSKLKAAINALLDVDEVININDIDSKQSTVFHKKSFSDKLVDFLKQTKSQDVDVSLKESSEMADKEIDEPMIDSFVDDTEKNKARIKIEQMKEGSFGTMVDFLSQSIKKKDKGDISPEQVNRVLEQSGVESKNVSISKSDIDKDVFRNDLREIIKITYSMIKKVPPEALKEFRQSSDFKRYVEILDKYNLVRKND